MPKTLVVDDQEYDFPDFEAINVPRKAGRFCWADVWAAGVRSARHDTIWYLDSDRLLPWNYLRLLNDAMAEDVFVFTSCHFLSLWPIPDYKELLKRPMSELTTDPRLKFEPRRRTPVPRPGKNVMSGNTAFRKSTFDRLGGLDPWYVGHGAFADSDFHATARLGGCRFVDLEVPELHVGHEKLENGKALSPKELRKLAEVNYAYYLKKWKLSPGNAAK